MGIIVCSAAGLFIFNIFNNSLTISTMIIPIKPWLELVNPSNDPLSLRRREVFPASGVALSASVEMEEVVGLGRDGRGIPREKPNRESMEFYHEPIMGAEILHALEPVEGKQVFDGTLGGGGHSELLLENGAHVIGCDQDGAAIEHAERRLARFGDSFLPLRGNFSDMDELLASAGMDQVDGILLDVGVSSRQLDDASRGFSFREEGKLDMRMDDRVEFSAAELVNEWPEDELVRIFREYGEENRARRIASEIVSARGKAPIETTLQLAEVVERAKPRTSGRHPATKVFQALRIAVNREIECLETALEKSVSFLAPGGVLAVVSFHSLEDRIVKRFLRERSAEMLDRPEWPEPRRNPDYAFRLPSRRAIMPDEEEVERNPRSRSAKLRVAVRV
jgi:16S rRNA (cytosine1402-N4)-methyltransferase